MATVHGKWIGLAAALSAASWVSLGQAELPLKQFQQAGTTALGVAALGGGLVPHPDDAISAVDLWNTTRKTEGQVITYLWAYTIVDFVFIACLTLLLWQVARQVAGMYMDGVPTKGVYDWNRRPGLRGPNPLRSLLSSRRLITVLLRLRPLAWFVVFDVAEDLLRLFGYLSDGDSWLYYAAWAAEKLKFGTLLLVILALVAGYKMRVRPEGDFAKEQDRDRRAQRFRTLRVLRGQVGLVVVLCALLLVDVTGQVTDFLRRWTDVGGAFVGVLALLIFSLVLWASGRRIALPGQNVFFGYSGTPTSGVASVLLVIAAGVASVLGCILSIMFDTNVPWALAIVLATLILLEVLWFMAAPSTGIGVLNENALDEAASSRSAAYGDRKRFLQALGRFLAATPVAVVGIVVLKAGTGPLVLSFNDGGYESAPALWLLALGLGLIVAACLLIPRVLERWDEANVKHQVEAKYLVIVAIGLVAAGVLVMLPIGAPERAGSLAVVLVALSVLGLAFAELQRFAEIIPAPQGMTLLGFKRVPIFLILASWLAVASALDASGHHDIRTLASAPPGPSAVALNDVWDNWLDENCLADEKSPVRTQEAGGAVPMVFVTVHGGGIRAAYWTGSVLTSLLNDPAAVAGCATATGRSRVFAVSSISGGSVGAAAYFAQEKPKGDWYQAGLGDPDYSAVALARGLLVDLPRALVGFNSDDRAGQLELAWEDNIPELEEEYFTHLKPGNEDEQWMPITMFNAAQAETGCRINTSAVRLANPDLDVFPDCRATLGSDRISDVDPDDNQTSYVPTAPVTVDSILVARQCPVSFRVSTAALMSARWPYISPSGRIPCGDTDVSAIDGGYADEAGYAGFLELWQRVAPLVAEHNASAMAADTNRSDDRYPGLVVPILVVLDNHYLSVAKAADPGRTPELLVPPSGLQRATKTRGADREQAAMSAVAASPPGTELACSLPDGLDPTTEDDPVRRIVLAPTTQPGLPAPLAWTLAPSSRDDLDVQREALFGDGRVGRQLRDLLAGSSSPLKCGS